MATKRNFAHGTSRTSCAHLPTKTSGLGKGLVLHRNAVGVLKEVMLQSAKGMGGRKVLPFLKSFLKELISHNLKFCNFTAHIRRLHLNLFGSEAVQKDPKSPARPADDLYRIAAVETIALAQLFAAQAKILTIECHQNISWLKGLGKWR